jgi:hypothetical protein
VFPANALGIRGLHQCLRHPDHRLSTNG